MLKVLISVAGAAVGLITGLRPSANWATFGSGRSDLTAIPAGRSADEAADGPPVIVSVATTAAAEAAAIQPINFADTKRFLTLFETLLMPLPRPDHPASRAVRRLLRRIPVAVPMRGRPDGAKNRRRTGALATCN